MAFADRLAFARKQKRIKKVILERPLELPVILLGNINVVKKTDIMSRLIHDILKKLQHVQKFYNDTRAHIFATIDIFIKASKLKNIVAL